MVIWIVAALVMLALIIGIVIRKRVMSPEQFAEAVRQRIISNHPGVSVKSAQGFDWTLEIAGEEKQLFLDNTYARYRQYRRHFEEIVDVAVRAASALEDVTDLSWEDAKSRVFPCLKSAAYIEHTRQLSGGADVAGNMIVFDYKHGLKTLIAIDSEMSMILISQSQLESWGISKDELLRVSIDNLSKLTAPLWAEANQGAQEHGFFAFATHDGYDASRILLPDFYERASRALGSERLLVGIPNRDFIAAIPEDAPWKDKFYKQIRNDAANYDHAISPIPITLP